MRFFRIFAEFADIDEERFYVFFLITQDKKKLYSHFFGYSEISPKSKTYLALTQIYEGTC